MLRHHHCLILLILPFLGCVDLANGVSSSPLLVGPLNRDHPDQPMLEALPLNAPSPSSQSEDAEPMENHEETPKSGEQNDNKVDEKNHAGEKENEMIQETDDEITNVIQPNITSRISTLTSTTSTSTTVSTSTKIDITTIDQPQNNQTTTSTQGPLHPCHLSCLEALNSTLLTPDETLTLSAGSSLTLECQIPLVPELILEDMLWLFHPGGTPEGQCSLIPHKYIPSCPGFPSLSETDDRNETFLKQTLTLSDLGTNHTGDYMCQVQVTCCPRQHQHLMSQKRETKVNVWWTDYTLELAVTGVVAAVLLLSLLGVSAYGWRYGNKNYYQPVLEVEAPAVHHLPFIDDKDTDSFNSSILNEQEEIEAMSTQ